MTYIIGIAITSFLLFILLTKRKKSYADKVLSMWLGVILVHLTLYALVSSEEYLRFPHILGIELPIPFLHGPFLYIYTLALTNGSVKSWKIVLHLSPYVLALFWTISFLTLDPESKISVYENEGIGFEALTSTFFIGFIFSGLTYTLLSIRKLLEHKKSITDKYSYTEKINLQWLFILTIGLACIWIVVFLADDQMVFSAVVVYVALMGYFGVKQVGIFTNQPPQGVSSNVEKAPLEISNETPEKNKYEKLSISDQQIEIIHNRLFALMQEKKLFLTPELTLSMVSKELNVHPNTLSLVINKLERKNFFDYINTLRVQEFKDLVARSENQKFTLLSLAYEAGFNSKTSFNRNFKKYTGMSPTQYLKENRIVLN